MKRRPIGRREAVEQKKVLSVLSPEYMKNIETIRPSSWRQQLKPGPIGPEVRPRSEEAMKRHEVAMRRYAGWTEDQMVGEDVPGWGRAKDHYRLTREDVRANPQESFPPTIEKYWEETPIFHGQRRPGGNIANAGGFDTGGARTANAVFISHSEYTSTRFLRSQDESFNLHTKWMYEGRVNPKKVFNHHDPTHVAELSDRLHAVLRGEVYTKEEIAEMKSLGRYGGDAERTAADFLINGEWGLTQPALANKAVNELQQQIQEGRWYALENRVSQDAIRDLGYDFFTVDGLAHHRGGTVGAVLDKSALKFHRKKALHAVKEEGVHQEFSTKEHTDWMPINRKAHSKYLEEQTLRYETDRIGGLSSQERRIGLRDLERRKKKMATKKAQRSAIEKKRKFQKKYPFQTKEKKLEIREKRKKERAERLKKERKEKFKSFKKARQGRYPERDRLRKRKYGPIRESSVRLPINEFEDRLKLSRINRKFNSEGMLMQPPGPFQRFTFFYRPKNINGSRAETAAHYQAIHGYEKILLTPPAKRTPTQQKLIDKLEHVRMLLGGKLNSTTERPTAANSWNGEETWNFMKSDEGRAIASEIFHHPNDDLSIELIKTSEAKTIDEHYADIEAKVNKVFERYGHLQRSNQVDAPDIMKVRGLQKLKWMLGGAYIDTGKPVRTTQEVLRVLMTTSIDDIDLIAGHPAYQFFFNIYPGHSMNDQTHALATGTGLFAIDEKGALILAQAIDPTNPELNINKLGYDQNSILNTMTAPDYVEELLPKETNAKKSVLNTARDTVESFKKRVKAGKVKRSAPKGAIESAIEETVEVAGKKGFFGKFLKIFGTGGAVALLVGLPATAKAAEIGGAAGGSNLMPVIAAVAGTGVVVAGWKAWSSRVAKSEKKIGEFAEEALGDKAPRFRIPTGRDLIGGRASLIENELELTTRGLAGSMSSVINDWGYVRRQSITGGVIDTKWGRVWNANGTGKYAAPGIARNGGIEGWATVRSEKELYQAWDNYIMKSQGLGSGVRRTAYRALGGKGSTVNKFLARWGGVGTMIPGAMAFYFAAKDAIHGYQKEGLIGGIKGAITGYLSAAIFNKVVGTVLLNGAAGIMGAGALVGIGYAAFKIFDVRNEGNQYLQSMKQKTSWAKGVSSFSGSVPATMRGRSLKAMEESQFSTLRHLGSEASMLSAPRSRYATTTRVWGSRQMLSF